MSAPFDSAAGSTVQQVTVGLTKLGIAMKSRAWQETGMRGLTPTQAQVLALLHVRSRGSMRLSQLAAGLGVTAATMSEAVETLVRKGLVEKAREAEDGRALRITLTEAGRHEADRVAGWPDFLHAGLEALTPDEQVIFLRGIIKIIRTLQERGLIPVAQMCVTCRFFRPNVHADPVRPHHCAFVDAPFGDQHLRIECPDYQDAPDEQAQRAWERFLVTKTTVARRH